MTDALDHARLRGALTRLAGSSPAQLAARAELPAEQALSAQGLPARTVNSLVRPVLSALLCDRELITSSRVADLALRCFLRGGLAAPRGGLAALPERVASSLPPQTVRTGVRAASVAANAVTTEQHGVLPCRAVVIATGAQHAADLLPGLRVPEFHQATVLHHLVPEGQLAERAGDFGASLRVDGDAERDGPLSHSWVATSVDPQRGSADPASRALVTSVVLGQAACDSVTVVDKAARPQLTALYGTGADKWPLLAAYQQAEAVPAMPAPHDFRRAVRVLSGLYVCGEHRDTSSAQGALTSGRRAASEVLRDFGLRATTEPAALPAAA